jgi:hypothetical protein
VIEMNVLVALAHYYRAEEDSGHSSTDPELREQRATAIRQVIQAWRGHFGVAATLNVQRVVYEATEGAEHSLDIVVLVRGDDHLLDEEFCAKHRVRLMKVVTDDPRMIPFAAWTMFSDMRNAYDMFVYSEDDLRPVDGCLVSKIAGFVETFGWRRVLMPNRYEWNPRGAALKTFIDGDLRPGVIDRYVEALPDEPFLRLQTPGREVRFRRAGNPHSGFFALTQEQLFHWIAQPHFRMRDVSFVSPLESAATLGVLKTFPIYKSFGRDSGWLEIQHLDDRFTGGRKPREIPAEPAETEAVVDAGAASEPPEA